MVRAGNTFSSYIALHHHKLIYLLHRSTIMTIQDIIHEFNELFEGQPWHGASILESLQACEPELVNQKPSTAAHSIAEILQHQLSWRTFVIEKLRENKEYDIVLNSENDWAEQVYVHDQADWHQMIEELKQSQLEIKKLLRNRKDEWLYNTTPGKNYTNLHMLKGLLYHDLYHLGQIRLLGKMLQEKENSSSDKLASPVYGA